MRAELTQSWELLEEGPGHMGGLLLLRAWAGGWRQGEDRVRMAAWVSVGVRGRDAKDGSHILDWNSRSGGGSRS